MACQLSFPSLSLLLLLFWVPNASAYSIFLKDPKTHPVDLAAHGAKTLNGSKRLEGSSPFVQMRYHMGPVLTSNIRVYIIWYGRWRSMQKRIIRNFLFSISRVTRRPSVAEWWKTVQLYTDQTGANVSRHVVLAGEHRDHYSHGRLLSRMSVQEVIEGAILHNGSLPVDSGCGLYMVLSAEDVVMQDFCDQVCGFHYFTFPSIVGYTLPYAWIGNSAKQCPELCAYPFAVPSYMTGVTPLKPPNRNIGIDGMISVIGHELAEISSNPLINAWYAGNDPTAPTEIADLCEGIYGTGGGGSYMGSVLTDHASGATYNMNGVKNRRFLVQWVWNPVLKYCVGPNALGGA
eukprot:c27183_g2_i3 orf=666-1703(-)